MQKVIIDTNVIVSSLIQKNYPYFIVRELFFEGKIQVCISEELFQEYLEVLHRPKFHRFVDFTENAKGLLEEIGLKAQYYIPTIKLDIISDQDDNMILELADKSEADFIITGNTTDFTMDSYKNTKIVSPKEYWEFYRPTI